jgi:hypothetical protein
MPDNEISFENTRAFREFMSQKDRDIKQFINQVHDKELQKIIRLNGILNTKAYHWIIWQNGQEN